MRVLINLLSLDLRIQSSYFLKFHKFNLVRSYNVDTRIFKLVFEGVIVNLQLVEGKFRNVT